MISRWGTRKEKWYVGKLFSQQSVQFSSDLWRRQLNFACLRKYKRLMVRILLTWVTSPDTAHKKFSYCSRSKFGEFCFRFISNIYFNYHTPAQYQQSIYSNNPGHWSIYHPTIHVSFILCISCFILSLTTTTILKLDTLKERLQKRAQ